MKLILKDPTNCPHCGKVSSGNVSIKNNFGLRNMGDGTIRVQSWCRKCRSSRARIVSITSNLARLSKIISERKKLSHKKSIIGEVNHG